MELQREQILKVTSKLFIKNGIRRVSIDEICAEIRISKKTFYLHFAQKKDLLEAVLLYNKQSYDKCFDGIQDKNSIDTLIFFINHIRKQIENQPDIFIKDIAKYYPDIYEKFTDINIKSIQAGFERNLRRGIEEGYYRKNLDVELISSFHSLQIRNQSFEKMSKMSKKFGKKRLLEFYIDLILHLVVNEKGRQYIKDNIKNGE